MNWVLEVWGTFHTFYFSEILWDASENSHFSPAFSLRISENLMEMKDAKHTSGLNFEKNSRTNHLVLTLALKRFDLVFAALACSLL